MNTISTYRYGSPRQEGEGVRIGVARQVPRGIRKEEWTARGYFDTRAIALAPSWKLVRAFRHGEIDFDTFRAAYLKEMQSDESLEQIDLAATLALYQPISLGCFCHDEKHCHRNILQTLLTEVAHQKAAEFAKMKGQGESSRLTSPVCYADDRLFHS